MVLLQTKIEILAVLVKPWSFRKCNRFLRNLINWEKLVSFYICGIYHNDSCLAQQEIVFIVVSSNEYALKLLGLWMFFVINMSCKAQINDRILPRKANLEREPKHLNYYCFRKSYKIIFRLVRAQNDPESWMVGANRAYAFMSSLAAWFFGWVYVGGDGMHPMRQASDIFGERFATCLLKFDDEFHCSLPTGATDFKYVIAVARIDFIRPSQLVWWWCYVTSPQWQLRLEIMLCLSWLCGWTDKQVNNFF